MFGVILISIVTVFHLYVFWRGGSVPAIKKRVPVRVIGAAGIVLWSAFFLGRFYGHAGSGPVGAALEFAGMAWMATLFLLFVALLAVDLLTGFGLLLPGPAPRLRGLALAAGLGLAVIALVQGLRPPLVVEHRVVMAGLSPDLAGTVVVAVSDLHLGSQLGAGWLDKRVAQVMAEKPDLILLLGDIYEGHGRPAPAVLAAMRRLTAPLGVWGVLGNHEFYGGPEVIRALSEESGLTVLRNAAVTIRPGLVLAGVEGRRPDRRPDDGAEIVAATLKGRSPGATILMSHKPWQAERVAAAGVGLMLSGHTHGGQIWPFGYLVRRYFPLLAGRYQIDGLTVLVGRGTGTWGPRMRLWQPGEILRVTLLSE